MSAMQMKAPADARSVAARIFTKDEHAQDHCQMGNMGLVLDVMMDWMGTIPQRDQERRRP